MIEIKNLHKAFGQNQVLKGVDITVNKGDVVVVIGPSGSGKTTMLRCINFLERADEGTITVGDITVDAAKAKKKEGLPWFSRIIICLPIKRPLEM